MNRSPWLAAALAAAALSLLAGPAAASAQPAGGGISLAAGLGYHGVGGDDFEGTEAGFGVEGSAGYRLPGGLDLGGGVGTSSHDLEGSGDELELLSLFGEARYSFPVDHPAIRPVVGARLGYRRWTVETRENDATVRFRADGFSAAALAGTELWIRPRVAVEVTGRAGFMSFGDVEAAGFVGEGTGTSGSHYGIDVGLRVLVGG